MYKIKKQPKSKKWIIIDKNTKEEMCVCETKEKAITLLYNIRRDVIRHYYYEKKQYKKYNKETEKEKPENICVPENFCVPCNCVIISTDSIISI